jgi:SNF2 family DNA or RNA helicase
LIGNADGSDRLNHLEQAAAAGSLQFLDVTEKEKKIFEAQEKWLDNTKLQREDEEETYIGLGINSRSRPHIEGMSRTTILKFWQVVAIWGLHKFHLGWLKGGLLADAVGLGKTIVILAHIQFKYNLRIKINTERERVFRFGKPKVTMVVVSPTLLPQWVQAIREHLPSSIVYIYYGSYYDTSQDETKQTIQGSLHKRWFDGGEEMARSIIITTYKTMARRHGPSCLLKARMSHRLRSCGQHLNQPGTATSKDASGT